MPALSRPARTLPLAATDLDRLRQRVRALAEQRPAVYRMTDATGRVLYVGKAKRLRARLLQYFRAAWPDDKASRILLAASDITWDYQPSEFAALLAELKLIRRFRPPFNDKLNRTRRAVLISLSSGEAPRLAGGSVLQPESQRAYGPFRSLARTRQAVRTLNDLLGLRDCALSMPIAWAGQTDLFDEPSEAACIRHPLGLCTGPCAGLITQAAYKARIESALEFLDGASLEPLGRTVSAMQAAASTGDFETAARWKSRFEDLEWLLAATSRARAAMDGLSFVYRDIGAFGDDRAYVVRQGRVRTMYPWPATPIERDAFRAVVAAELQAPAPPSGALPIDALDEVLLVMSWFRRHPAALARTEPLEAWAA